MTTTHNLLGCLLLFSLWGHAQQTQKTYDQIPIAYRSHPELGRITYSDAMNATDYELVNRRTQFSRTFLNTNRTKTTVQSSAPLHCQDGNGFWRSIEYRLSKKGNQVVYPAQNPFFESDGKRTAIIAGGHRIQLSDPRFIFASDDKREVKKINAAPKPPVLEKDNALSLKGVAPDVDKNIVLYPQAFKYAYAINKPDLLPSQFDHLIVEETLDLPRGFSFRGETSANGKPNRVIVLDPSGKEAVVFHQPLISDSKQLPRNLRQQPYESQYHLIKLNETRYKIQIHIPASWLQSPERVFPINIDPVVTVSNTDAIPSCFFPAYQQTALQVDVPAGETVLSSNISYDFVAVDGSGAWLDDQRSFVSGPNGETPVVAGSGTGEGMQTYTINNSEIGNIASTGQITYTFHFARNWGGTECGVTFNYVSRREVSATYGTIEFGDGPLVINEYSASNRNFNDSFARNEDWVELYNASPDTYFDLAGYYLSNNINNPTKWQISGGVIPPGGRVLVFCSNRNISSGMVQHASFDLTQTTSPDEIVLADPSGNVIESHTLSMTQTNHSYGRTSDGASTWSVFSTPTPGAANANGFSAYATKPALSVAPGKYASPITVSLTSAGPNEQIRYTTDGATPTATSTLYTGPISVAQSTVIRARAFSTQPNILPGFIETNTYFIGESSTLPTVSISGDANLLQLLGGTQIEPTGYFEFFETDGTFIDETMGDFDKHGNDSWAYAQRGIDFIARDDHGYKRRLEHQFFGTTDRGTFRRLILKAAGSDNYPHQSGGAHFRDVFAQTLSQTSGMDLDERRARFVSLFVNGQYWGVYDLREKVDDNQYTDYYYGQDYIYRDSDQYIQYIKTWGDTNPEFGNQPAIDAWDDLLDFVQNNDMSVEANYNYVESQLNINSLVDYFVLNSYLVNKDWLNWNTSWWRGTNPSGGALKWRYALWDVDGILGHYINYTGIPDISANAPPCQVEEIEVGVGHAQTIAKLVEESPIVRQKYITRYADLLNTHLSCERATQVFDSIVAIIQPEMPRQIARWGGSMTTWLANVQQARDFLMTRCLQTINTGLNDCYETTGPFETTFTVEPAGAGKIRMNSEWLASYPFTAQVLGNIDTLLRAEASAGYAFSHWEVDGATISPEPNNPDIVLQIAQATSVTAHYTEIVNSEAVIYYWHFNTLDTSNDVTTIPADYNHISGASPLMTYTGSGPRDIDGYNTGSAVNLHMDQTAGRAARVRNPSQGRPLVFDLPTMGYKDIKFAYAVQRTNEGMLTNQLSYSLDGTNFIQSGLAQTAFNITTDYSLVQVDFTSITAANNNANFKVQIVFDGNTTADNGNNRFDNVTLKGVEEQLGVAAFETASYQVFPNPFNDEVQVASSIAITELSVFDMVGKKVWHKKTNPIKWETIDLAPLNAGVYLLKIKTTDGTITHKLVKR